MRLFKNSILFLAIMSMILSVAGCNILGFADVDWTGHRSGGSYVEPDNPKSCRKFFAMYGDFKAQAISNDSAAAEFCRITAWKSFRKTVYNESGPDSGYAYMVECCSY